MTSKRTHAGIATLASAAVILSGGIAAANMTAKRAHAATGAVKILYTSHLRRGPGTQYGTTRYLQPGESYKYVETRTAQGYTWYRVSPVDWVASAGAAPVAAGTSGIAAPAEHVTTGTASTGWLSINTPANLRQGPGLSYGVARTLAAGEVYRFSATRQADGFTWYLVGRNQWVANGAVTAHAGQYPGSSTNAGNNNNSGSNSNSTPTAQSGSVRVNYAANLRQSASLTASVVQSIPAGGTYTYDATQQADGYTWYRIGTNQWIASAAVTAVAGNSGNNANNADNTAPADQTKASAVVALARQQLGKPYVWGGKGPNVFDCSGLMYYVFLNAAGVNIGGWTVPQESSGREVSLSALQPGDILFWGPKGNTYHDALYIGNNQYIAAPEPGQVVQIQTISQGFQPNFAVRVL
ncbi:C40 family peptidase [Schleiferilactobacillus shenzhenensis]|uniref:NlpC/P60 domain-containing protein n=1 Tax=Schleiferilactobacillus shenzhenensis LY-73 TaxID=1231336 RepID=U4TMK6_9LACO|nr:C40 family peptidase [Schleiferilactobacillus shenzhenensis]ERL64660.1 hypothetical protein L248_0717 [Schleiferilactobacillus shenzhenensis LY-73]